MTLVAIYSYLNEKLDKKNLASFMKEMATKANSTGQTLTNYSVGKHLVQKIRNVYDAPSDIMQINFNWNTLLLV